MKPILIILMLLSLGLIVAGLAPYELIQSLRVSGIMPERHFRLACLLLFWGLCGCALSGIALVRWSRFQSAARTFRDDFSALVAEIGRSLRSQWLPVSVISVIALGTRLPYLDQPMRYDEAYSYLEYASLSPIKGIALYRDPNNHLLNTFLMHISVSLFGLHAWACRLPALIAGVVLAPAGFLAARTSGSCASWLAGLAIATNPVLIEYSTTGRGYQLQALLVLLLFVLTRSLLERSRPAVWSLWIVTTALALWTIPTSIYPVAAVVLQLLIGRREKFTTAARSLLVGAGTAALLTAFLYSPVFAYSGFGAVTSSPFVRSLTWSEYGSRFAYACNDNLSFLFRDATALSVGAWIIGVFVAFSFSADRAWLRLAAASLAGGLLLSALQRVHPPPRVWLFLIPLGIELAAVGWGTLLAGLADIQQRVMATVGLFVLASLLPLVQSVRSESILLSNEGGVFRDAAAVVQSLRTLQRPHEPILAACPAHAPLVFYAVQAKQTRQDFLADWRDDATIPSTLIVVNHDAQETLDGLLEMYRFSDDWKRSERRILAEYPTGQLVRITHPTRGSGHAP